MSWLVDPASVWTVNKAGNELSVIRNVVNATYQPSEMEQQKRALADTAVNQARALEDPEEVDKSILEVQELLISNEVKSGQIRNLCKKEIGLILNVDNPSVVGSKSSTGPKSVNEFQNCQKSNFDILNDKSKSVSRKVTLESDMKKLGKRIRCLAVCGKENRSSNGSTSSGKVRKNPKAKIALSTRARETPPVEKETLVPQPIPHVLKRLTVSIVSAESVMRFKKTDPPSPIEPNPHADLNTVIFGRMRKVKVIERSLKPNDRFPNDDDNYDEEFLDVTLKNIREQGKRIILRKNFLTKFNPDAAQRATVVSWMLDIQNIFNLGDSEFYLSVNLLDQVLARLSVPRNMCQLVALCCIWIANKFIGRNIFHVQLLMSICAKAYNKPQVLNMEQKILKLLEFRIHSVEPSMYVNAYMKLLKIESTSEAHLTVYFVLDCAIHLKQYSEILASVVAAAAVTVAFHLYHRENVDTVKSYFNENLSAEDRETCKILQVAITSQIRLLKERGPWSLNILNKYKDCTWLKSSECTCSSCLAVYDEV